MTGRVRSASSRSGQSLCWPSLVEVPLQALKSAVALVACIGAGGSEQLAHDEWGGVLPCLGRYSLRPENGAALPRQFQSRHNLVCDQRLSASRPGSPRSGVCRDWGHTPIWIGHGGCASTLEAASPLLSPSGSSWIAGKLTKPVLNPEERIPGAACPRGASARGTEHPYVRASRTCLSTPLN